MDNLPEALSLLQLLLFLAERPHWSKNRRGKMSPFNRDFIQDMTDFSAMTTLLRAIVVPGNVVCEQRPRDVIL